MKSLLNFFNLYLDLEDKDILTPDKDPFKKKREQQPELQRKESDL